MGSCIRQNWDSVNDCADFSRTPEWKVQAAFHKAIETPIPEYRAKLVRIAHGQSEISITPANSTSVINARMGFNPLLDCPRKVRSAESQEERDKENKARSAKRARYSVRVLVKSSFADHMLTFATRENITDRRVFSSYWKEFVRLMRVRYPDWAYVAVLEQQDRGAYHLHVAVQGKQDIKWIRRCWLIAIGQPVEEVSAWLIDGVKLGDKSMGSVNVQPPMKRSGGATTHWRRDKMSAYLTKYIGKEFEVADKHAKKYWHSRNMIKPVVERFWLRAKTYAEAVVEAHDLIYYTGATSLSMWGDQAAGVIWITGETERHLIGKTTRCEPDFDLL